MRTLYYTVTPDIHLINKEPYLGKKKILKVYDLDTQYISLIEIYVFSVNLPRDPKVSILEKLKEDWGEEQEFNLIKL